MQTSTRQRLRRASGFVLVAISAGLLAACASPQPKATVVKKRSKEYFAESEYGVKASPRVATGRAIPRGGGRDQLGKPYQFGSQGPDTWDCSGLVSKAWKAAGVDVFPQTEQLVKDLPAVTTPQPGDLLYKPGHVQMFLMNLPSGKQLIVEAPRTGKDVQVVPQWMNVTRTLRPSG